VKDEHAELVENIPMAYAGTPSQFEASWKMEIPGFYETARQSP
jgi:hypothetical protein